MPSAATLGLVSLGDVLDSAHAAVVPIGAGLGGEYLGGDAPDTKSSEVTRCVTDEDTPHGSGKARGRVRSGTETAAVVAAIQAEIVLSYSRL